MADRKPYYITTAIAYASGKPHIGNTYEAVLADSIARRKRQEGYDVVFQTGTDEHGQKNENKAKEEGITPQELVDRNSAEIKRIWDLMNTASSVRRIRFMRRRYRRSSGSCMTRAISTRASMRAGTASRMSPSSRNRRSSTEGVRTADGR